MAKKKRKRPTTKRQRKLVEGITKGLTIKDAGALAGYADRHAAARAFKTIKLRFHPALVAAGYDVSQEITAIYAKIKQLMEAQKIDRHSHQGIVMETFHDADADVQLRAANEAAKFIGVLGNGHDDHGAEEGNTGPRYVSVTLVNVLPSDAAAIMAGNSDRATDNQQPRVDAVLDANPRRPRSEPSL